MTPEEAIAAAEDLQTGDMIPICHGTFRLSMEKPEAPKERLSSIVASNPDLQNRVRILAPGESFDLKSKEL
jgi:L-ascorbate metabolism protein UlaG (beta-lactamase superfamily)